MIQGSIASLTGKVQFNGEILDETKLRAFLVLGEGSYVKKVGTVPTGKRGRPQNVYNINESVRAKFEVAPGETIQPVEFTKTVTE